MTITVIIIIAAVIGQVLTTLQALFYAVYVYCFPKMAAAIYLRLHNLLHCITDILPIKWWSISPSLEAQWTPVTALTNRIWQKWCCVCYKGITAFTVSLSLSRCWSWDPATKLQASTDHMGKLHVDASADNSSWGSQHQLPNMCKTARWVQAQLPSHCSCTQDPEQETP